ncbi:AAA family ATPase [Cellulomonas gelida]|uniref:AAA family ATPase n=1 Tax=Cellulomonas gelida TaxID=1712 RepID=UPI00361F3D55
MRLNALTLHTAPGPVRYDFRGPLTVLTGPVGVGKSSLFELMKHALGGSARVAPVARDFVEFVELELDVGDERYRLSRNVQGDSSRVGVFDMKERREVGLLPVAARPDAEGTTVGALLLRALGLPDDTHTTSAKRTARVTFNNVWSFLYVEQREIDRSIARNNDSWSEPARKTTFELLFGLTNREVLRLRKSQLDWEQRREEAAREERAVIKFLEDSKTRSRAEAAALAAENERRIVDARRRLAGIMEESESVRGEVGVLRTLVLHARREQSLLAEAHGATQLELGERRHLLRSLETRSEELGRGEAAASLLGPIDFVVCPRCSQSVKERRPPTGACVLCLQPEPEPTGLLERRAADDRERLASQLAEARVLVQSAEADLAEYAERIEVAQANLSNLESALDEQTKSFVSPRLAAVAEASVELARAETTVGSLEQVLRQWDRAADLQRATVAAGEEVGRLIEVRQWEEDKVARTRERLLAVLSENYDEMVRALGIPSVQEAYIDVRNYLPYVNGDRFDRISTGGIMTSLVTAYWLAVVATALREGVETYPTLLIVDTPRKSIGAQNADLADELYRQLDILAGVYGDRMQVIVADNDIPRDISKRWQEMRFDYPSPTVPTVAHPGPSRVKPIDQD